MEKEKELFLKAVGNTAKGKRNIPLKDLQIEYRRQQELEKAVKAMNGGNNGQAKETR